MISCKVLSPSPILDDIVEGFELEEREVRQVDTSLLDLSDSGSIREGSGRTKSRPVLQPANTYATSDSLRQSPMPPFPPRYTSAERSSRWTKRKRSVSGIHNRLPGITLLPLLRPRHLFPGEKASPMTETQG